MILLKKTIPTLILVIGMALPVFAGNPVATKVTPTTDSKTTPVQCHQTTQTMEGMNMQHCMMMQSGCHR